MFPRLLHDPPISTYGTCLVAAIILAWLWSRRRARRAAIPPWRIDLLVPALLTFGLLGARLLGILTDALTPVPAHSSVLIGALLASTAAGITYALWSRIALGILGDILAPPIALTIALGRIGCFFGGCCFGKVCVPPTFLTAVRFPPNSFAALFQQRSGPSLPVYPVQLYESAACFVMALFLWRWRPNDERGVTGQKFLALGITYAAIRFCMEFLRADNPPIYGLSFSQWGVLVMAAASAATWLLRLRYHQRWHIRRPA